MINKLSNKKRFIKNFKNLKIKNKKFFKVLSVRTLKQITLIEIILWHIRRRKSIINTLRIEIGI